MSDLWASIFGYPVAVTLADGAGQYLWFPVARVGLTPIFALVSAIVRQGR